MVGEEVAFSKCAGESFHQVDEFIIIHESDLSLCMHAHIVPGTADLRVGVPGGTNVVLGPVNTSRAFGFSMKAL